MKAKRPSIYWLDKFGLSIGQLTSLGRVKIKFHAYLRHINEKSLFRFKPSQRIEKTKRHYELLMSRVKSKWSHGPVKITYTRRQPRSFSASIEARSVAHLLRMPEIHSIWLDEVSRRKPVNAKPQECWFSVKARFAIQIEGKRTGMQSYEDRIVMVKATCFEDAENRLQSEFKKYEAPYLNSHGHMVRWKFERVLHVYEVGDEIIDPRGVEVFSVLARRRIKPEYAWKVKHKKQVHAK
ncbi:MAG TPA: DUF4288 domain-containing protein [Verrucomicrobiae bacterium]|jgi:hypothetical protein